jgi:hypothetical protein
MSTVADAADRDTDPASPACPTSRWFVARVFWHGT